MATNNSSDYSPTQYNTQVGGASGTLSNVAPSATSGVPLISQGAASNPAFGTAVVAGGGTGVTSNTAYAVLCGGATSTGAIQSIAGLGSAGNVLTSNGAGALPSFQVVSSGSFIKLQTITASNSSSVIFNSTYITGTYNNYFVIFQGVIPVTNNVNFNMDWSTNNGSTYLNSNFQSGNLGWAWNNNVPYNGNSTSTNPLNLGGNPLGNTTYNSGQIYLYNLTSGVATPAYTGSMMQTSNIAVILYGNNTTGSTINNIKFSMSSGNISAGTFTLYGLVS